MRKLSVVIPCYNEQESLPLLYKELCAVAQSLQSRYELLCEFVFVNDGSRDGTLGLLRGLSEKDGRVHYLSFSRNFGKEAAIYAPGRRRLRGPDGRGFAGSPSHARRDGADADGGTGGLRGHPARLA